ncbi:hypothetical protein A5634_21580 [Mycobacterium asiaticum]|uniref:PE domain-containing protein n=1 Tax=Mycobacterium asiaticum TaxID=1790 RepID=A0A1A3P3T0_MYCAS|nr:hypothetical protein [Mycobacterium asiaticum]OBK27944.1 hypothetical protein A5634_21580 [Mycobacterium asiaticum]
MSTVLELQLEALGRLRPLLGQLGGLLRASAQGPHAGATPDPGADSPSLVAARGVSGETIPGLQNTIADRFIEVGNLIEVARTQFARAESDLTSVITSAGSLLPSG